MPAQAIPARIRLAETTFILLSLSGFRKKRARTPPGEIALAESRPADWRRRGRAHKP